MPPEAKSVDGRPAAEFPAGGSSHLVPSEGFGSEAFFRIFPVSRETREKVETWMALLETWGRRINLISPTTFDQLWHRHLFDSAQWFFCRTDGAPLPERGIDLGSGAGFPGLALSILGSMEMTLVESDRRKAAFLRQVIRETGALAEVHEGRIENLAGDGPHWPLVTARALSPLDRLLAWAHPLMAGNGALWAWKGRTWNDELTAARRRWHFDVRIHRSRTEPAARMLEIRDPVSIDAAG